MNRETVRRRNTAARQVRTLVLSMLAGAVVGGALAAFRPRQYQAELTAYFPSVNSQVYTQLTQALRVDPMGQDGGAAAGYSTQPGKETHELASLILGSRAAATFSLKQAGVPSQSTWWDPDPVERFRKKQLVLEQAQASGLRIQVEASSPETARQLCEALISYYSDFVKSNPLTVTSSTRKRCEAELAHANKKLSGIEAEMMASNAPDSSAGKIDPKVARELYRKRLDQTSENRQVLDTLHRIRAQPGNPETGETPGSSGTPAPLEPQAWNNQWNRKDKAKATRPGDKFGNQVKESDLLKRAQLERRYEDNLLIYRSLLLQASFLRTWEALETDKLEIVDPIVVRPAPRVDYHWPIFGAVAGAALWFLLSLATARD